jgi:outer membrane protein assembly factor BamB
MIKRPVERSDRLNETDENLQTLTEIALRIDITDGSELWSFSTGGSVQSGVAIEGGTAVVGSDDGNVYGLQQQAVTRYDTPRVSDGTNWSRQL